jgi:hypothetical protein
MASLTLPTTRLDPRLIYILDGVVSATMGMTLAVFAESLTALAAWSLPPSFLFTLGLLLLPWSAFNFALGRMARPAAALIRGNLAVDGSWVLGSLALIVVHWSALSPWGVALLVAQMLAVACVFAVKLMGDAALRG